MRLVFVDHFFLHFISAWESVVCLHYPTTGGQSIWQHHDQPFLSFTNGATYEITNKTSLHGFSSCTTTVARSPLRKSWLLVRVWFEFRSIGLFQIWHSSHLLPKIARWVWWTVASSSNCWIKEKGRVFNVQLRTAWHSSGNSLNSFLCPCRNGSLTYNGQNIVCAPRGHGCTADQTECAFNVSPSL